MKKNRNCRCWRLKLEISANISSPSNQNGRQIGVDCRREGRGTTLKAVSRSNVGRQAFFRGRFFTPMLPLSAAPSFYGDHLSSPMIISMLMASSAIPGQRTSFTIIADFEFSTVVIFFHLFHNWWRNEIGSKWIRSLFNFGIDIMM